MSSSFANLARPVILSRPDRRSSRARSSTAEKRLIHSFQGYAVSALPLEIFQLRYEVYCLECGFLPADDFSGGFESDEYETCSTHFAAYTHNDFIVGTVRLVQPPLSLPYPFEEHCTVFDDFEFPPREQSGEISRLIVRKSHRRRSGISSMSNVNGFIKNAIAESIERPQDNNSPMLLLQIYREMYRHSRQSGIRFWYAAMEKSLARSLNVMGFQFVPIGPQTDYYGPVTPFMIDLHELDARLKRVNSVLAAWFNDGLVADSISDGWNLLFR